MKHAAVVGPHDVWLRFVDLILGPDPMSDVGIMHDVLVGRQIVQHLSKIPVHGAFTGINKQIVAELMPEIMGEGIAARTIGNSVRPGARLLPVIIKNGLLSRVVEALVGNENDALGMVFEPNRGHFFGYMDNGLAPGTTTSVSAAARITCVKAHHIMIAALRKIFFPLRHQSGASLR